AALPLPRPREGTPGHGGPRGQDRPGREPGQQLLGGRQGRGAARGNQVVGPLPALDPDPPGDAPGARMRVSALGAVRDGLLAVRRRLSLLALLLAVNLATASLLALPLVGVLEEGLKNTDASGNMLYGFDYAWWTAWHTGRAGWTTSFQ